MITISHLTKIYPGKKKPSLDAISLSVKKGDIFGFLGPNGAGKTTTVKILMGLMRPTKGEVKVLDESPDAYSIKKKIGFLPENPYFYQYLSGIEFLRMCADIFSIPEKKKEARIKEVLKEVHLQEDSWKSKIRTYSKGMQQRLGIAQALINDPELVVLDEPMSGLDPLGRREMKDVILRMKREGKTVFFNSHILADVEDLCSRVAIIDFGKIILEGDVAEITKKKSVSLEKIFIDTVTKNRR